MTQCSGTRPVGMSIKMPGESLRPMFRKTARLLTIAFLTISQTHAGEAEDKHAYFTELCDAYNEEYIYAAMLGGSTMLCQLVNDKAITEKTYIHYLDMFLESSASLKREIRKDIRKGFMQCAGP